MLPIIYDHQSWLRCLHYGLGKGSHHFPYQRNMFSQMNFPGKVSNHSHHLTFKTGLLKMIKRLSEGIVRYDV